VIDVNVSGNLCVGGLAGVNNGTIENCFASGSVSGVLYYIGGLVGSNRGLTSGSYSRANATGEQCVGSLSGENYNGGSIQNSYATGSAVGSSYVGGLTGSNNLGTVTNSYSTGSSSGGGLIGFGGTCSCSFWDTLSSGKTISAGGLGKSTTQMKTQSTYTDSGWNFATIWEMVGTNYPRLRAIPDPSLPVELISITAAVRPGAVTLNWQTATEKNNYGFEIERKQLSLVPAGQTSVRFNKIGFVSGSGNSNSPKSYSFTDDCASGTVVYRLKQIDNDGNFTYSQEIEVTAGGTPAQFSLDQNYPNPFNPTTTIAFSIPQAGDVTLKIFDALGREVATLVNGVRSAGEFNVVFNASSLSSGIYFYRLQAGNYVDTKKLVLMK